MATTGTYQGMAPYLSVWDVISLGWLYYPIISLVFVAFSLWIAAQSAQDGVEDAKRALVAACGATEKAATSAASLPRWLAQNTNDELNAAIRNSIEASHNALEMVLTIVEAIIGYVIDSFKALQLCLFQFVVRGSLAVLIQMSKLTTDYLNPALNGIADGIQTSMNAATSGINAAIDTINNQINRFNSAIPLSKRQFGGINIPSIPIPNIPTPNIPSIPNIIPRIPTIPHVSIGFDVNTIRSFKVPETVTNQLTALNNTIPTLDQLRDELQNLVGTPFNLLKAEMNTTFAAVGTPNVTVPLPPMVNVEFCDGLDTGFIDELGKDLVKIAYIGIGVLVAIAVIIFVANGALVWLRYKFVNRHVDSVKERWSTGNIDANGQFIAHAKGKGELSEKEAAVAAPAKGGLKLSPEALMRFDNELSHSFAYKVLEIIDKVPFIHMSPITHDRLAWYLSYIFSPSALVCFLVGLFGILAICIQLIAIKPIQRKVNEEVEKAVQLVMNSVGSEINATMGEASATYATNVNAQLAAIDQTLNGELFTWIGNATAVLNNTVVAYYDDLERGINSAFGNTILANPMLELVRCIIGGKIDALQGAVAFLQAHLRIPIPRVSPDVLLLSSHTLGQVSSPIAAAATGGGNGGVFGRLVDRYLSVLRSELITFGIILGVWGFICLMGLVILLWDIIGRRKYSEYRNGKPAVEHSDSERETPVPETVASHPAWWRRLQMNRTTSSATAGSSEKHGTERNPAVDKTEASSTQRPSPVTTPGLDEPTHALPTLSH
ncbi:hypothetical protein M408DRAFT_25023 [Serendipita vermifera MAFF 305830]|uniref:Plasma membrane fusion protein PRM1 n=1 Tax=Serendipita vermifera MAFF 305830 TaxID=933852 RepID=A0A0C3B481_SERVB|nr:hypothetical protein M408DRAFT_25023 [Serendipita vermifera MAFF 305830]